MFEGTAKRLIDIENDHIDYVFNATLKECFGTIPDKISLTDWFKFNQAWQTAGVFHEAKAVQMVLRDEGYNVVMDMQTCRLKYLGRL